MMFYVIALTLSMINSIFAQQHTHMHVSSSSRKTSSCKSILGKRKQVLLNTTESHQTSNLLYVIEKIPKNKKTKNEDRTLQLLDAPDRPFPQELKDLILSFVIPNDEQLKYFTEPLHTDLNALGFQKELLIEPLRTFCNGIETVFHTELTINRHLPYPTFQRVIGEKYHHSITKEESMIENLKVTIYKITRHIGQNNEQEVLFAIDNSEDPTIDQLRIYYADLDRILFSYTTDKGTWVHYQDLDLSIKVLWNRSPLLFCFASPTATHIGFVSKTRVELWEYATDTLTTLYKANIEYAYPYADGHCIAIKSLKSNHQAIHSPQSEGYLTFIIPPYAKKHLQAFLRKNTDISDIILRMLDYIQNTTLPRLEPKELELLNQVPPVYMPFINKLINDYNPAPDIGCVLQ